jgi:hypothetical protein
VISQASGITRVRKLLMTIKINIKDHPRCGITIYEGKTK